MKFSKRRLILACLAGCAILMVPAAIVLWMSFHPKQRPVAPRFSAVVAAPDLKRVYIADFTQREILAYSLESGAQVGTISLRDGPGAVALSPDGAKAYAMTYRDESNRALAVIDTGAGSVLAVIPANAYPHDSLAVSADGKRLTLASTYGHADASTVQIDTTSYATVAQARVGGMFHGMGVLAPHGELYAIAGCATCEPPENHGWGNPSPPARDFFVTLLRPGAPDAALSMPLGDVEAHRISISPDGGVIAVVPYQTSGALTSVRLAATSSGRMLADVRIGPANVLDMKFSHDGKVLYVLNAVTEASMPTLVRIDVKTQAVSMLRMPYGPREIAATSHQALVYLLVTSWERDRHPVRTRALIQVVDSQRGKLVHTIAIEGSVLHMLEQLAWNAAEEIRQYAPWSDDPPAQEPSQAILLE
jgi:hypothetical protein